MYGRLRLMSPVTGAAVASRSPGAATSAGGASFVATADRVYPRRLLALLAGEALGADRAGLPRPPRGAAAEGLRLLWAGTNGDLPSLGRHRETRARRRLSVRSPHPRVRGGEPGRRDRRRPGGARRGGHARDRADLGRRSRAVPARRRELRRRRARRAARAPADAGPNRR